MKNTIFTLILLSIIFSGCKKEDIFETDLLVNNTVEIGNDTPTGWFSVPGPYQVEWSESVGFNSDRSLKISSDVTSADFGFHAQEIDEFEVGKFVELKVQIKKENLVGSGISIAIRGDNDDPNPSSEWFTTSQSNQVITGNADWEEYSLVSTSKIPDDITKLTIYLIMLPNTTGTVYFDDISLSAVD